MADFPDQFPIAKFHFRATIDGQQISFQEVSGLDHETEVLEYRHGDNEEFWKIKGAGLMKYPNLTLKKGIFEGDDRLQEFFNKIYEKDYYSVKDNRFDCFIELLDETGDTVHAWNLTQCFPVKLSGTDLKSDGNEVAIETLEIAYEHLETSLNG
jgi:phage tail-like protein